MRISTKGDYATRALQDLALHYDQGPIPIEKVASRQGLPVRYLEQLLLTLKRAGLLLSKRGVNGGYSLARPPSQITLGEVLRAVEGPIEAIYCVGDPPRDSVRTRRPVSSARYGSASARRSPPSSIGRRCRISASVRKQSVAARSPRVSPATIARGTEPLSKNIGRQMHG